MKRAKLKSIDDPSFREVRSIGRMGLTETVKKPGDKVWNSRKQEWDTVK